MCWLSMFFPCKCEWVHICNLHPEQIGLYQCSKCKTISLGAFKPFIKRADHIKELDEERKVA